MNDDKPNSVVEASDARKPDGVGCSGGSPCSAAISALAPRFGSKRNLAKDIIAEFGDHRVYWEPFCGSMSVLMNKEPCVMETVNDLHRDLINLARVVQHDDEGPRLFERLTRTAMHEGLFADVSAAIADSEAPEFDPQRAYQYCIVAWLGAQRICTISGCEAREAKTWPRPQTITGGWLSCSAGFAVPVSW